MIYKETNYRLQRIENDVSEIPAPPKRGVTPVIKYIYYNKFIN